MGIENRWNGQVGILEKSLRRHRVRWIRVSRDERKTNQEAFTLICVKHYKSPSPSDKGDGSEVKQTTWSNTPVCYRMCFSISSRKGNRIRVVRGGDCWPMKICCLLCNYQWFLNLLIDKGLPHILRFIPSSSPNINLPS